MAKQRNSAVAPAQPFRRSARDEGHPLSLLQIPVGLGKGSDATVSFGLDIGSAPVPQRRYAAEFAHISVQGSTIRFVFAQGNLDGNGLDSALVLRVNAQSARNVLTSIESIVNPTVQEIAEKTGVVKADETPIVDRPLQMATMVANFVAIAISGYETCLDFYHASAFAMRMMAADSKSISVEPVVRVDIETGVFMTITDQLRVALSGMPSAPEDNHG